MATSKVLAQTEGLDSLATACTLAEQGGGAVILPFKREVAAKRKSVSKQQAAAPIPVKKVRTHKLFHREKPKATFDAAIELLYNRTRKLKKIERLAALRSILRLFGSGTLSAECLLRAADVFDDARAAGDIDKRMEKEMVAAHAAIPQARRA